jgi:hypothetical protein
MSQQPVSTGAQWRERARQTQQAAAAPLPLPSGATVRIARPPIETWVSSGRIPETLSRDVIAAFGKDDPEEREAAIAEMGEERAQEVVGFMRDIVVEAVVEPKIVVTERGVDVGNARVTFGVVVGQERPAAEVAKAALAAAARLKLPLVRAVRDDEFALDDIPPDDFSTIFMYVLAGVPGQPVATKRGEVSVSSLRRFRRGRGGSGAGKKRRSVRKKAE